MLIVLRFLGALAAGLAVAFGVVVAVEMISAVVHPFPEQFGGSSEEMHQHVANYPAWFLAVVVPMWGAAAFAGAWIAGRLGNRGAALLVGLLLVAAVILNISMLPYPIWFEISSVAVVAIAAGCASGVSTLHPQQYGIGTGGPDLHIGHGDHDAAERSGGCAGGVHGERREPAGDLHGEGDGADRLHE